MMSPEFMRKLQELRQQRLRTQDFQKWKAANPTSPTGEGKWNAAPWTGQTAQTLVYDTTNGKAFPNPQAALSAGVNNFSYQIPSGMTVDWSYWDQYRQPPPPAPKPAMPVTVVDQTVLPGSNPSNPVPRDNATTDNAADDNSTTTEEPPPVNPFAGIKAGRLAEAQRYADAGMMGRARQQILLGGGTWGRENKKTDAAGLIFSKALRTGAKTTTNYGGDFKDQAKLDAVVGKVGTHGEKGYLQAAKKAYEKNNGKGSWTKSVTKRLIATSKRNK
jgi:hypothetical protein